MFLSMSTISLRSLPMSRAFLRWQRYFAFAVETHPGAGVELLPTLRFAYGEPYLRDAIAAGALKLLTLGKAAFRTEKAAPVEGLVLVAGT